ncbi:hypothetical protein ACOMHN_062611 [Nucella lapillus]
MEGNHNIRSDPHSDFVVDFLYAGRKFKILVAAVSLGIFDDIEAVGQGDWATDSALASYKSYDLDNTRRFLNTLASLKLLDRGSTVHFSGEERQYRNIMAVKRYMLKNSPNSLVPLVCLEETLMPLFFKNLPFVLKQGSVEQFPRLLWKGGYPQDDAFLNLPDFAPDIPGHIAALRKEQGGESAPGAMCLCPREATSQMQIVRDLFLWSWDSRQAQCLDALLNAFDLRAFKNIVDLGAGSGLLAWHIVKAYPNLYVTVYDTPRIIDSISRPFVMNQNIRYVKGDFFKDRLPEADCFILSHVLHEYDDDKVACLLSRVHQHLNPGGSLIILEKVLQDDKRAPNTCIMDDLLLATMSLGRQRSESEYKKLLEANGLLFLKFRRILGVNSFDALMAKKHC